MVHAGRKVKRWTIKTARYISDNHLQSISDCGEEMSARSPKDTKKQQVSAAGPPDYSSFIHRAVRLLKSYSTPHGIK